MSNRRRRLRPPQTVDVRPEDLAERLFFDLESPRSSFRALSLCRQAREALSLAVADLQADPRLQDAWVVDVEPHPGPERLLVTVALPAEVDGEALEAALSALIAARPHLRSEVARAIHRKRVPELAFRAVPERGGDDER